MRDSRRGEVKTMLYSDKVRENRVRRYAKKEGKYIKKYLTRCERSMEYGRYMIIDIYTGVVDAQLVALKDLEEYFGIEPHERP